MKQTLLCFFVFCLFSCTKEELSPVKYSVIGKWKIVTTTDCTNIYDIDAPGAFIEFRSGGEFSMDTLTNYYTYKQICQNYNRYRLDITGDHNVITLYNHFSNDSLEIIQAYGKIHVSSGYSRDVFIKTR